VNWANGLMVCGVAPNFGWCIDRKLASEVSEEKLSQGTSKICNMVDEAASGRDRDGRISCPIDRTGLHSDYCAVVVDLMTSYVSQVGLMCNWGVGC